MTARCCRCASAARDVHAVELEPDGIDTDALAGLLRGDRRRRRSRSSPTSSPTSRTPPATRSRRPSARRCWRWPPSTTSGCSRTTRTSTLRFSGETLPSMLSMDPEHVVYASSFSKTVCPGIRVGYLVGPADLIAAIAKLRDEHVHLAEHGRAVDRLRVLRLGRDRQLDRDGQDGAGRARADARTGAAARAAGGRVRGAGRRLLHVGDAARGHRRARSAQGRRRARGVRL